jgi:hypothetical protein
MGETGVDNHDPAAVEQVHPPPPSTPIGGGTGAGDGEGARQRRGGGRVVSGDAAAAAGDGWTSSDREGSARARTDEQRDNLLLLLGVSVIAACCLCWFLEHLDYLLKPLVFAVGLSLILRPFVDFLTDARYQEQKLRRWNVKPPWAPRTATVPRVIGLILALSVVMLVSATFIW